MRKFFLVLVLLALVGLSADRVSHRLATDEAETRLVAHGLDDPEVKVGGFPFLDQLLRREFDEVHVRAASLETEAGRASRLEVTAHDVTAPSGGPVTVARLSGHGTVTYAEVLRQVGIEGLRLGDAGDGRVRVRRDVAVQGVTATATATAQVESRGQRLRVVPTSLDIEGGGAVADALADTFADQLSFTYSMRALPDGVTVDRVVPGADGFVVTVSGRDLTFSDLATS